MAKCKATYEALNSQLIEELPTLIEVSKSLFITVLSEFALARKLFVGRITKELLTLMDVSIINFFFDTVGHKNIKQMEYCLKYIRSQY